MSRRPDSAEIPQLRATFGGYLGAPLAPHELSDIALGANVPLQDGPDFTAAAEAINSGLQMFVFSKQPASTPGEFERWFQDIAAKSEALLTLFRSGQGSRGTAQATRNFLDQLTVCRNMGFDPLTIDDLTLRLDHLKRTAAAAAQSAGERKSHHRKPGTPNLALADGTRKAWRILTAGDAKGFSTPGEGQRSRRPAGPFVSFASGALAIAARRFGASKDERERVVAPDLAEIAASPWAIDGIYRCWIRAGGASRWRTEMVANRSPKK